MTRTRKIMSQIGGRLKGPWPSIRQWLYLLKILQRRERWLMRGLVLLLIASILLLVFDNYLFRIHRIPQVGGRYTEGMLGQARFINPVLSPSNDVDRDLVQLIYSSLFKYDGAGQLIPDLVEEYFIEEGGLTYRIVLKKDIFWHDQESLTADDVIFTIKTIQDAAYKSPLRVNWQGVRIEKVDDFTVEFKLNNVYAPFLHNLAIAILPKHLWGGISAQNFALAQYNLKPVGSGPYKFEEFSKDEDGTITSMELVYNENYYLTTPASAYPDLNISTETIQGPFIKNLLFKFYGSHDAIMNAYKKGQIDGMSFVSPARLDELKDNVNVHSISLPAYYAVFFNQTESELLADKEFRRALAYAVNRSEIIEQILNSQGSIVDSPILPGWSDFEILAANGQFDQAKAISILEDKGWSDTDGNGIREQDEETELVIELMTTDWPELEQTAQMLREQWEQIGVRVNVSAVNTTIITQNHVRPRQYEALLFGEVLSADPDPFAFWHSSQVKDPGLNLALYENKDVDKLLEEARQTTNSEARNTLYLDFQEQIQEDLPAIFLYSAAYLYPVTKSVRGISIDRLIQHSYRFSQIENWYIKTKFSTQ